MLGDKTSSRHDKLVRACCWAMTEAAAGWYSAEAAEQVLAAWWRSAFNATGSRKPDEGEFSRAIVHGVGVAVANADDVAEKVAELDQAPDDEPASNGEGEPNGKPPPATQWSTSPRSTTSSVDSTTSEPI
jgi:hypothetical protein